jgi:hypothetical protein
VDQSLSGYRYRNIEGGDFPVPKPDMDGLEYIRLLLDHKADPNAQIRVNTMTRTIFTMQWLMEPGATRSFEPLNPATRP